MQLTTQPTTNPERNEPWECRGEVNLSDEHGLMTVAVVAYGETEGHALLEARRLIWKAKKELGED